MLIVISPSKTLDYESELSTVENSQPQFVKEATELIKVLRKLSASELEALMKISPKLAQLNLERFLLWQPEFTPETARQALFTFKGEVYEGLNAYSLGGEEIGRAQRQLRILSGLYGVLKPLDLIRPYRLEMGTSLKIGRNENLYHFWQKKITDRLKSDLEESGSKLLINLASVEYFRSIDTKRLKAKIVTPEFRDWKEGHYKIISFWAKRARGLMTRFILQYQVSEEEQLEGFDSEGYYFNRELSKPGQPVFTRE